MVEINLEQNTEEWLKFRLNKIGASQVAAIMGICPFRTRLDVYNEIKGLRTQAMSQAMQRGRDLEARALHQAELIEDKLYRPAVFQHDLYPWAIASLDGIDLEETHIVEIKCPGRASFEKMKKEIPLNYIYQMQWQMFVTGIETCMFLVYSEEDFHFHRVECDKEMINELLEKAKDFYEEHIVPSIPPEPEEQEPVFCDDEDFKVLEELYVSFDNHIKNYTKMKEGIKKRILEDFYDDTAVKGTHLIIKRSIRKGLLDEEKMLIDGINLEKYRKPNVSFPVIKLLKDEKS